MMPATVAVLHSTIPWRPEDATRPEPLALTPIAGADPDRYRVVGSASGFAYMQLQAPGYGYGWSYSLDDGETWGAISDARHESLPQIVSAIARGTR